MKYLKTHSLGASVLLKLFILCALIFPVYFSSVGSPYYPEIIVSNILLVLSCMSSILMVLLLRATYTLLARTMRSMSRLC